jgi:hypothetical protein
LDYKGLISPKTSIDSGVYVEFENYIELKIGTSIEADRKQGKHRDGRLLTVILSNLFWARTSPDQSVNDILPGLGHEYKTLKYDTLEDNLRFLSSIGTPPFLKISKEREGNKRGEIIIYDDLLANITRGEACLSRSTRESGRPRNLYSLDDYYIENYFSKSVGLKQGIKAAVHCLFWKDYPDKCPDPNCKICSANDIEHPPA